MTQKKILIIHPNDKSTAFLNRPKNHLLKLFQNKIHHFNIHCNDESHKMCIERIKTNSDDGFIIFLGHGKPTRLYGAKGKNYDNIDFVSQGVLDETPDEYYYNDNFINENNLDVFQNKKVFCLSCNSNNKIASCSIEFGAKVFLGFGNLPTSLSEFKEDGIESVSNDLVKLMKTELNYIIKKSLDILTKVPE